MEENMEPKIEKKTNKKKVFTIVGAVAGVIVIAAAAFIGGRFLNQRASPGIGLIQVGGAPGGGNAVSMSIEMIPAPELPTTAPEVSGTFTERKDNILYVQTFSMDMGSGGGVVVSSASGSSSDDPGSTIVSGPSNTGPKVEVVVTNDTLIYKDVTAFDMNPGEGTTKIQQVVEPGNLDDLATQTMLTVWGRKVGDRVIAEVIFYSMPVTVTGP
jgi:hypothetical protein